MRNLIQFISAVLLSVFFLSSCGDVGITKRRHLPGYHVDFSRAKKQQEPAKELNIVSGKKVKSMKIQAANLSKVEVANSKPTTVEVPTLEASTSLKQLKPATRKQNWKEVSQFMQNPVKELRKEKLNGELKRTIFYNEDEKHGWSVLSFVSIGLGVVGLGLVISGLALLFSFVSVGGFAFWWLFLLIGLFIGIAAMVTGIIAMRQTRGGEKRGRGFALAGMISGIVSLALGLIGLLWGFIYTFISNRNEDF